MEIAPETFSDAGTNIQYESYGDPEALKAAIEALAHGQRRAIEMLRLKEMTLREAAIASGMSVPALKVAVHRHADAAQVAGWEGVILDTRGTDPTPWR